MRHLLLGALPLSVLFVFLWSSGWIGSKYGLDYAGTFSLLTWRYLLVVLALALLVTIFQAWRKLDWSEIKGHLMVGVLSHAVYLSASISSMDLGVSVGMVAFVLALQPMLTAVVSAPFTGEKTNQRQWIGIFLGLFSVLLVVGDRLSLGGSPFAYSLLLISTFGITLGSLINRRMELGAQKRSKKATPVLLMLFIHCTGALLFLVPIAGYVEGFQAQWVPSFIFSITYLGLVISLGAYGLMFVLLGKMSATKVSSLLYMSPAATMVIAYFAFGEHLTPIDLIGLVLAALAVWIVSNEGVNKPVKLDEFDFSSVPSEEKNRVVKPHDPEQVAQGHVTIIRNPRLDNERLVH
jgi:drug/metabolite transporter (DMT)-like permease